MEPRELQLEELISIVDGKDPHAGPIERLVESVMLAGRLDELADELVGHYVDRARDEGASWAEIGEVMGVSRQAVQKRFVAHRAKKGRRQGFFLTRFADEAREVVKRAERHARQAGSSHVGTEHLVMSLTDDPESAATAAIVGMGASLDEIRAHATAAIDHGSTGAAKGHIPFSAASKKVLELSLREALRAGDRHIATEHILLGILRDERSPGFTILSAQGVTRRKVEEWMKP
jgi:hypothetical protein